MEDYSKHLLRTVVAQICQAIGWETAQQTAMDYLTDALQKYLHELGVRSCRYSQHYGRTEVNLDDVGLAFRDLNINVSQLLEYINNVESVACAVDVPRYPVRKDSNLNFLKAGSKEVITRPVHIHEHLPPIYPEKEEQDDGSHMVGAEGTPVHHHHHVDPASVIKDITNTAAAAGSAIDGNSNYFRKPDIAEIAQTLRKPRLPHEEEGRPTREISSVMMTSGGFISPAREGKLPDAKIPIIPEPAPLRPPTPPRPITPPMPPALAVPSTPTVATSTGQTPQAIPATVAPPPPAAPLPLTPHHPKSEKKLKRQRNAPATPSLTTAEAKEQRKRDRHLAKLQKRRGAAASAADATTTLTATPEKRPPTKRSKAKELKAAKNAFLTPQRNANAAGGLASSVMSLNSKKIDPLPPVSFPADLTIKSETVPVVSSPPPFRFGLSPPHVDLALATRTTTMSFGSLEIMAMTGTDDVKLSSEPDKEKYSIFKKISKKGKDKDKPPTPGSGLSRTPSRTGGGLTVSAVPGLGMPPSGLEPPVTPDSGLSMLHHHGLYSGFPPLPESTTIRRVPAKRSNLSPHTDPNVIVVDDDDDDSPAMRRSDSSPSPAIPFPLTPSATPKPLALPSPYMHFLAGSPSPAVAATPKKQPRKTRVSKKQQQQQQQAALHGTGEQSHPLNLSASPAMAATSLPDTGRADKYTPRKRQAVKVGRPSKRAAMALPPGLMSDMLPNVFPNNSSKLGTAMTPGASAPQHGMDFAKMDEMSALHMFKDNPLVSGLPRYPLLNPFHLLTGPGLIPNTNFMGSPRNPLLPFHNPFVYSDFMGLRPSKVDEPRSSPTLTLPPELQSNVYCNVPPLVPDSLKSQLKESSSKLATGKSSSGSHLSHHHPKERSSSVTATTTKVLDTPIEISDDEKSNPDKTLASDNTPFDNNSTPTKSHVPKFHETDATTAAARRSPPDNKSEDEYEDMTIVERDHATADKSMSDDASPNVSGSVKADKKRDKEHKKGKRGKDGKIKKKKDKKDKSKSKEKTEKRKEEKKEKDRNKKKKEKRKDKMRLLPGSFADQSDQDTVVESLFSRSKLRIQTGGDTGPPAFGQQQHFDQPSPGGLSSSAAGAGSSHVPKLTLKFGSPRSVASDDPSDSKRTSSKSINGGGGDEAAGGGTMDSSGPAIPVSDDRRDSSPELARISPLVTRPPKQKTRDKNSDTEQSASTGGGGGAGVNQSSATATSTNSGLGAASSTTTTVVGRGPGRPPKNQNIAASTASTGGPSIDSHNSLTTIVADSTNLMNDGGADHSKTTQAATLATSGGGNASGAGSSGPTASNNNISLRSGAKSSGGGCASSSPGGGGGSTASATTANPSGGSKKNTATDSIDADGNQVWICPACGRVDDGTPMIGCDGCDAWYHWVCVGIQVPPDEREDWYCRVCIAKKQEANGADKKKKRKKKNKTNN